MTKRIAVIDREVCRPDVCRHLCKRVCPLNRSGEECVTISSDNKPLIDESLCIGCGICVWYCPENCIRIKEDEKKKAVIDYSHCKGCLICKGVCPSKAIDSEKEMSK